MRSIALASVAVPTVERASPPIRCWSTRIAGVSPSRTSTSGRASVGMNPCTNALYVSLISRCDSAAIVPNTSELLPEPETPVNTVSLRFGISTLTSLRLCSRAPWTRIMSWPSASLCSSLCLMRQEGSGLAALRSAVRLRRVRRREGPPAMGDILGAPWSPQLPAGTASTAGGDPRIGRPRSSRGRCGLYDAFRRLGALVAVFDVMLVGDLAAVLRAGAGFLAGARFLAIGAFEPEARSLA